MQTTEIPHLSLQGRKKSEICSPEILSTFLKTNTSQTVSKNVKLHSLKIY